MSRAELQGYRLSPQQARSWVIQQHCAPYCVQCALELEGDLDLRALKNGLSRVIHRHEILRTSFTTAPGLTLPVQVISLVVDCSWWTGEFDPPGQQAGEIPEEIERLLQEERRAFANDQDSPLVRAALATIAVDKHLLVLTISAMCADTWTLGQMVSELLELHDCMVLGGGEPGSPSEPVQYADFAEWQNQLISESGGHTGSEYWRRNGARGHRPNLPFERKSALPAFRHDSVNWTFDRLLTSQVQSAATDHSTTSAVFLFTCWQILIWRMTGETEVAAGWTCHGRDSRETEVSLGPFAKVLPIRCHPQGLRFAEVLHLMNGSVQEATGWQEYFDVQPAFGADGPPECSQLGFEFYEWPKQPCPGPLRASLLRCDTAVEPHKLKLTFVGFNSTIRVQLAYDSGLFSRIDAESIKRRFDVLLRSAMAGDTVRADDLRLLDETERTQLLRDFSNQDESRWADRSIHEMFELREAALPDAAALCSSESQITYRLLNQRANQCARRLRRAGVSAETVVGIFVERSPDLVIAMLAVLKAGGAYVVLDPNYPRSRLAHLLEDTNTRVVVSRGHMLEALGPYQGSAICFDRDQRLLDIEAAGNLESLSPESSLAYIAYTSGSTGKPKGILANHTGVLNYLRYINQTYSIDASDKVLQLASFTFDASVRDSIGPLTAGATVILPSAEEARDPVALLALIRRSEVTRILSIVPTMLRNLTAAADERGPAYRTVQTILVSGEPLYMPDCERTRAVFHATAMLVNQYGPTESTMTSTYHRLVDGDGGNSQVPIGKPIPNSRLYILGPRLDLTPPGTKGLVHIGGAGVARGYLNRPGLTAQRFIPDPFSIEIGMRVYDVGDLAYYTSTGDLELAGRKDHQVKVRGVRIELGEIEAALGQHPSIRESAAVAREDRGETTLVAFYTSAGVPAPSQAELRAFLRERLPEQALPSALVELWTMPLTPNGKVDRAALAHSALCVRPPYVAPRTLVEQTMAAIWANVLEVEKPGVTDNFFDLGGHSLRAASLIYKVLNAFQIELPLRSIFDFPTLGEFCGYLVSEKGATQRFDEPPLEPVPARGRANRAPLSFSQQRLWFLDQLNPASAAYNLLIMLRLNGVVSEPALATGFEEILNRHEALRTRFTVIEDQPFQIIDEAPTGSIAVYDLRTLPVRERESVAKHLASAEAARPFDLSAGPLFKASLFRIADTEHVLLITMHHIVSDLWSIGILVRELAATYASLCCGKPGTLADLPIQYTDFAVWQRDWMRDEVLESQLTYWTTQLAGLGVLRLPSDRPRPPVQTHQGAREGITLTNNSVERLNALVRQESAPLFIGLLAGFMVLLHRYSGDDDIAVGSPSANRNRGPVENLVGLFANTLVLRTNLGGNPSFRELVRRVRTTALDAYAHQDVPFEKIVESLQPHRDLSRNPLFQVLFALQNVPMGTVALPALEMEPIGIPGDTARFDLALWFVERPFGLAGSLEYSTDLFDRETIAFLIGHLQNIIASAAADPEHRIGSLALLAPAERSNLLFEWNHPHPDPPAKSINQLFEAVALRLPDSVAIACEEKSLTFGDLNRCADQLSAYLRKLCPTPSNRFVGICLDRSIELIVAILGVWKSGAAYVPLDPTYPSERLAQMIADSHTVVVLADEPGNAILPPLDTPIVRLDLDWPAIAQTNWPAAPALMDPDEPAYVIFTSGSTGRPKGVVVCHTSVVSLIQATDSLFDLPGQDVWTLFHSCSFDISVWEISRCLLGGSRLIVVPGWMTRSPASFYGLLRDERVTILNQTPSALRQLIDAKDEA
ncbi:MAG TPA: amino acid adenylation domain-containing protein, partial [Blastocatellia bacterium]|nr:amino acid adenylation domain-containing protein [Blastocatellia bacterium]